MHRSTRSETHATIGTNRAHRRTVHVPRRTSVAADLDGEPTLRRRPGSPREPNPSRPSGTSCRPLWLRPSGQLPCTHLQGARHTPLSAPTAHTEELCTYPDEPNPPAVRVAQAEADSGRDPRAPPVQTSTRSATPATIGTNRAHRRTVHVYRVASPLRIDMVTMGPRSRGAPRSTPSRALVPGTAGRSRSDRAAIATPGTTRTAPAGPAGGRGIECAGA